MFIRLGSLLNSVNERIYSYLLIVTLSVFVYSCAHQLPPPGGEDDTTPPKIINISPEPNSINFRGNNIEIEFDEYVDRRSFEESIFISPKPKGEVSFSWSGTEVEIEFDDDLDRNKTFMFIINKGLRDVRGGNYITEPIVFAISTGSNIDKGKVSGKVYTDNFDDIVILAYILTSKNENELNPEEKLADYIIQVNATGSYAFENLPSKRFRLFALRDSDRNFLYDKGFDEIAVLSQDLFVSDTLIVSNADFLMQDFEIDIRSREFINTFEKDTLDFIYSSVKSNEKKIPVNARLYFYFKNNDLSRLEIADNIEIMDTTSNKIYKPVYNWLSDSLLEIFFVEEIENSSVIRLSMDLRNTKREYYYDLILKIAGEKEYGKVSGKVIDREDVKVPIYVILFNKNNLLVNYSMSLKQDSVFVFEKVLEGKYTLFSFADDNDDGVFFQGDYFPFKPCDRFIVYPGINVRGGWSVDNIFISYSVRPH